MERSPLLILIALLICSVACSDGEERIRPQVGTLTTAVYASVEIEPDSMYRAHASVSGLILRNRVREGMTVTPGTVLLEIEATSPEYGSENARLQFELAQSQFSGASSPLQALEAEIGTARLTFQDDSINLVRQQNLWEQNIGSRSELESRILAYERSKNRLKQLQAEYERLWQELQIKMVQARNTYKASKADAQKYTVESRINGKVYALYLEPGELVQPNQPLAVIGSPDTFLAKLRVDEVDVVLLAEGQPVRIRLDAYGEAVFEARITKIYPQKNRQTQTFLADARFVEPPEKLYPGLTGEANIIVARKDSVLTIPRTYLMRGDRVRTPDGIREIEVGIRTIDRVEVQSGLDSETELLIPQR